MQSMLVIKKTFSVDYIKIMYFCSPYSTAKIVKRQATGEKIPIMQASEKNTCGRYIKSACTKIRKRWIT